MTDAESPASGAETRTLVRRIAEDDLLGEETFAEQEPPAPAGYQLERRLGRGGCGVVYLARDLRLDRPVALKYISDAGPADLERFRREARFTARLRNPSIVPVFELGQVDGRPFIAMQYIDGGSLASTSLDHRELVRVVREVALALRSAHAEGIVHRDIKPENILLDREGRAYLTDFGLARSLHGALGETISHQGQIMGTPALMPPEQARGDLAHVDARSDVYGLGATLYVKLTGSYPFDGLHVVDVLHSVIHDPVPLPRSRRADIPRSLEAVVLRCMRKAPADRYASMDELIADLDQLRAGGHLGAGAWFRRLVTEEQELAVAQEPPPDEASDPELSEGLELVRRLAAWDAELYRVSGSLQPSFERLDGIRRRLDEILQRRPDSAWARFYRGVAHFRAGRLHAALEDMEPSIDRVRNVAGAYFELGRLYLTLYLREHRVARKHLAESGVRWGLDSARGRLDQAAIALAEAQRLGGELPGWHADYARAVARLAESDFDGCVELCDRITATDPDVEQVWKLRGDAQRLAGADPFASYGRALEIRRSDFETLHARAEAHLGRDQLDEARAALAEARRIHPGFAPAAALQARVELEAARRAGSADPLAAASAAARAALEVDPSSYDATVTLAEIQLEAAAMDASNDRATLGAALETLAAATTLDGCQNRVSMLTARALLARAGLAGGAGRGAEDDLRRAGELCGVAAAHDPDNDSWRALRRRLAALTGGGPACPDVGPDPGSDPDIRAGA